MRSQEVRARYNEMVDAGFDADFGKRAKYLKKIGRRRSGASTSLRARVRAVRRHKVNENYQALRTDGEVIPVPLGDRVQRRPAVRQPRLVDVPGRHVGRALHHDRASAASAATGGSWNPDPVTEADVEALA